jgi:hypothetical protein
MLASQNLCKRYGRIRYVTRAFSLVLNVVLFSYITSRWWRERKPVGENCEEEVALLEEEESGESACYCSPLRGEPK